jgi:hypothetical protein
VKEGRGRKEGKRSEGRKVSRNTCLRKEGRERTEKGRGRGGMGTGAGREVKEGDEVKEGRK